MRASKRNARLLTSSFTLMSVLFLVPIAVLSMNNPRVFGRWRRQLAADLPVPAP